MPRVIMSVGLFSVPLTKRISDCKLHQIIQSLVSFGIYLFHVERNATSKGLCSVSMWKVRPSNKCQK